MNQKGNSNIALVVVVLVILAGGFGYWMWVQQSNTPGTSGTPSQTPELPTSQDNPSPAKPAVVKPTPTPIATVGFSASATSGIAPLEVLFSGTGGQGQNRLYFGDGKDTTISCLETCTQVPISQSHVYSTPGVYTAKLMRTYYPFDFKTGKQKTVEKVIGAVQIRVN